MCTTSTKKPISIYIHWPFCTKKCPYCDFNSFVYNNPNYSRWSEAYVKVIRHQYEELLQNRIISSIFFGGGTPSLMQPSIVNAIIDSLYSITGVTSNVEITLEANPTSVEMEKFLCFRNAGINRISLGIQSLNENNLSFLGRNHNVDEAKKAIEIAAKCFSNYSLDFIYALPHQTVDEWQSELKQAISFNSNHLSLYQLTIEQNTKFGALMQHGLLNEIDDNIAAEMFIMTNEITKENGLMRYEVSNHAKTGYESKHNMNYWQYGDYIGIGPGAHSRFYDDNPSEKIATVDIKQPELWIKSVFEKGHGVEKTSVLCSDEIREEMMMMGLRTKHGIEYKLVADKKLVIDQLLENKMILIYQEGDREFIAVTNSGLLLLNSIITNLI